MRAVLSLKATMTATATAKRTAKKATGLDWQNINFARTFFLHFFAFFARLRRNAPINVNPVGGGSAGKGWGFDKF